jgi:hypothetical protein
MANDFFSQTLAFSDEEGTQEDDKSKKSSHSDKKEDSRKENEKDDKINRVSIILNVT